MGARLVGESARTATGWPADNLLGPAVMFSDRDVIVTSGSEVRHLYLIEDGVVGRFVPAAGRNLLEGLRTPGWLLGAAPAMRRGPHEATVLAMTNCVVRSLPVTVFRKAIQCLDVSIWLNEMLASDLRAHTARAAAVVTHTTQVLVEELFIEMMLASGRPGLDGSIRLPLQMSVTDVGDLVGASREHTSRILGDLEAIGLLVRVGGWFVVPFDSRLVRQIHRRRLG